LAAVWRPPGGRLVEDLLEAIVSRGGQDR
jgi:hypothetical protein